jgi:hypothetical protein
MTRKEKEKVIAAMGTYQEGVVTNVVNGKLVVTYMNIPLRVCVAGK